MAGKTNQSATQFAQKKLLGKANTSNLKSDAQELIGSSIQAGTQTLFGQAIPAAPTQTLNLIQSASDGAPGTVEYVDFIVQVVTGTTYDANNDGGGGDGAQDPGPHCYKLKLKNDYQGVSANSNAGTYPFRNNVTLHETLGKLQIVPPNFSQAAPNPYILNIYDGDPGAGGSKIALLDEIDWQLDPYNGILFIQDYDASKIPTHARGFIYVGKMLDDVLSNISGSAAPAQSGSVGDNLRKRSKKVYFVTESVSAGTLFQVNNSDFSISGHDDELVDISLNGALLVSGTSAQVAQGDADYRIVQDKVLRFAFDLRQDDIVAVSLHPSGTTDQESILTFASSSLLASSRRMVAGDGMVFSTADAGIFNVSTQRIKTDYIVTASHGQDLDLVIDGAAFDSASFKPNRIDVFVNGRMMMSGTTNDYFITGPNKLYFKFDLNNTDKITSVVQ